MSHAKFSPSGSKIWLACPASIRLSDGIPDTSGEAAERGTRIHQTAEELLQGIEVTHKDHIADALPYVDFVQTVTAGYEVLIEQRVYLINDFCYGTADIIAIKGNHGLVIDLKTGRQEVKAQGNPQLAIYAAAAAKAYDLHSVEAIIWQTGLTPTSDFLYRDDFQRIEDAVKAAVDVHGSIAPRAGDHCQYCKARAHCRARALDVLNVAGSELTTNSDLGLLLTHARKAADWAADIEARALQALTDGAQVEGYKLVEGVSRRKWADNALEVIDAAGLTELVTFRQPLPITQVEKQLGKREVAELLSAAIEKPPGNPTVAPETDQRARLTTVNLLKGFE